MKYFLDSNIISYILKGNLKVKKRIEEIILNNDEILIPSIAFYEVKRGLLAASSESKLVAFNKFVNLCGIVDLSTLTLEIAAKVYSELKKTGTLIEDDDIFIGCSALEHNATLITNNAKHLSRIQNLNIESLEL